MTMSKLLKRTRKCCLKIFQRLNISSSSNGDCDNSTCTSTGHTPFGRNQTVNYTQHKDGTPTKPVRHRRRVIPSFSHSPDINHHQQRYHRDVRSTDNCTTSTYDELSIGESRFRVNLYGSAAGSYDDFDRMPSSSSRDWMSADRSVELDETGHPVVFVENRVYVNPGGKDEFKCYDLETVSAEQKQQHQHQPYHSSAFLHSTPKASRRTNKKVLFEKVNYEKYKRARSERSGDDDYYYEEGSSLHGMNYNVDENGRPRTHWPDRPSHYFSQCEIDRNEYEQRWCEDLINWSREAAEYQKKHRRDYEYRHQPEEEEHGQRQENSWFQDKLRSVSGTRYNKMSSTDDSGVVCHLDDSVEGDPWCRASQLNPVNDTRTRMDQRRDNGTELQSWEAIKEQVFEPAESGSRGTNVLARRCSCNSMCTSLCTVETWLDDETFDNSFNEELERRCGISTN